jgi:transmembrane sensor
MNQDPEILISKHLSGENTPDEEQILTDWLALSGENRLLFSKTVEAWEMTIGLKHQGQFDTDQSWKTIENRLGFQRKDQQRGIKHLNIYRYAAAALLLVAVAGAAIWFVRQSIPHTPEMATINYQANSNPYTLPDGTEVWLNRNTSLTYPLHFEGKTRPVNLTGEAFFKVVHNEKIPFEVITAHAIVRVLGTSFNVKAYEDLATTQVLVETGKVRFCNSVNNEGSVILTPGEIGRIGSHEHNAKKELNSDPNYLAWKTHRLVFKETTLLKVSETLQSVYGMSMGFENEAISQLKLTGKYDESVSFEGILETITVNFLLKAEKSDSTHVRLIHR